MITTCGCGKRSKQGCTTRYRRSYISNLQSIFPWLCDALHIPARLGVSLRACVLACAMLAQGPET